MRTPAALFFCLCTLAIVVPRSQLHAQGNAPAGTLAPGVNPDDPVGELILRDTPLDAVLTQLEQLTGRIVLRPQALPAPQITLNARALTRAEAIFALETVLSLNGIGLVPSEDRFLKVVPITNVRAEAPELYVGSLRDEPASGKVVSKLFRLQHIDTTTFQQQVAQFLSGFGSIVPFQNSNAVIVTDTVANLQRLEYVVEEVDRQVEVETKFYEIRYAQASELAQQIRTMLESARTSLQGTAGAARGAAAPGQAPGQPPQPGAPPQPAGAAAVESGASLQSVLTSNTSITPDDRTNQIIVITNPANLPFFDNLIAKLDVSAEPLTSIAVIPMNYAKADELAGLLSDFISGRSQARGERGSRTAPRAPRTSPFPEREPYGAEPQTPANEARNQAVEQAVANATGEGTSQFSELVTINSDERTNSIIVAGTNNDIALLKRVIAELDVVLAQVRIDVLIAEVTLDDNIRRGIDAFRVHFRQSDSLLEIGDLGVPGLGLDVSGNLDGYTLRNFEYTAILDVASDSSNINLLSAPNIVTTHNQPASVVVGESRPILSSTITGLTGGVTTQQVNYQDIALTLDVTPLIGPNDVVQLEVKQAVNDVGPTIEIGDIEQPSIVRREASAFLSVKSGEMIVLGGLTRNSVRRTKTKMFLLGEIPLLGELFTRHVNLNSKQELLIFLRPVVLRNTSDAHANALESLQKLPLSEENAKVVRQVTDVDINELREAAERQEEETAP